MERIWNYIGLFMAIAGVIAYRDITYGWNYLCWIPITIGYALFYMPKNRERRDQRKIVQYTSKERADRRDNALGWDRGFISGLELCLNVHSITTKKKFTEDIENLLKTRKRIAKKDNKNKKITFYVKDRTTGKRKRQTFRSRR